MEQIWIPNLVFSNSVGDLQIKNDEFAYLMVQRTEMAAKVKSIVELHEDEYFLGSGCPLELSRIYDLELHCQFQLINYPFDYQLCLIIVSM